MKMMLEDEIFKKYTVDWNWLVSYGFIKEEKGFRYVTNQVPGFKTIVFVFKDGHVKGTIWDTGLDEEYVNYRIESQNGTFVSEIREAYIALLKDIRVHCFKETPFVSKQANRIAQKILEEYQVSPEFLWKRDPLSGVFRHPKNGKWFGIIQHIKADKLKNKAQGFIDILNVKLDEQCAVKIVEPGFYPAYHMNKKSWISVCLDDTVSDEEVMDVIRQSYIINSPDPYWLIPANANYYDMIHIFDDTDITLWKQSVPMYENDIVFLYVSSPYSSIFYQCEIVEANLDHVFENENIHMQKAMRLKLKKRYDISEFALERLKEYGIKSVRGPRHVPKALVKLLEE